MITLTKIRELNLSAPASAGRPLHLSAASGLACVNSFIYVVADDELHLGVFRTADSGSGHLIRLFDGALPDSKPDRKKQKPDLEALTLLPAYADYPNGALLVLGSGSKRNRRMGTLLRLDAQGAVGGSPQVVDLSPILAPLDDEFPALKYRRRYRQRRRAATIPARQQTATPSYDLSFRLCSMRLALSRPARSSHPPSISSTLDRWTEFHSASPTRRLCQMAT